LPVGTQAESEQERKIGPIVDKQKVPAGFLLASKFWPGSDDSNLERKSQEDH
jgi:hypothetical protein